MRIAAPVGHAGQLRIDPDAPPGRSPRRASPATRRRWLGAVQSFALHAVVLSGLGAGWRFAIAPSESDLGRTPLGCSFPEAMPMPAEPHPPIESAIAADEAEADPTMPMPVDASDAAGEVDDSEPERDPLVTETLDAMAFLADTAPLPHPRSWRGEDHREPAPDQQPAVLPSRAAAPQASAAQPSVSRILKRVDPTYPRSALRHGRQGVVHVRMTIAAGGRVVDAIAEVSSGSTDLDEAALAAVRQWEFERATDGDAQPRVITIQIRFQLTG